MFPGTHTETTLTYVLQDYCGNVAVPLNVESDIPDSGTVSSKMDYSTSWRNWDHNVHVHNKIPESEPALSM